MRLTGRGRALLLVGLGLFGAGVGMGFPVLTHLAGAIAGAFAVAIASAGRQPQLQVERRVHPRHVERDQPAHAQLKIVNLGNRRAPGVQVKEPVGAAHVAVLLGDLAAGSSALRTYDLPTARRGVIAVGPLTLSRGDALGLVSGRATVGSREQLWVHPKTHRVAIPSAGRMRTFQGSVSDERLVGSQEFHALREYVIGDELRHVHWKTTARTGQLMVREHLDPQRPGMVVVLDVRSRGPQSDGDVFEEAAEVAASLVRAAVRRRVACQLLTTDGRRAVTSAQDEDDSHLMDCLAEATPSSTGHRKLRQLLGEDSSGSCLALVGAALQPQDLADLVRARRQFDLVAALGIGGDPVSSPAGVVSIWGADAGDVCASWNRRVNR